MEKELNRDNIGIHEYDQLAMRILTEIKKDYPTTTISQIDAILDRVHDWVSVFTVNWTTEQ